MLISRQDIWGGAPFPAILPLVALALRPVHRAVDLHPDSERRDQSRQHPLRVRQDHARLGTRVNVLVIGGGGREHALAWKLAQSPRVAKVYRRAGQRRHRARARARQRRRSPPSRDLVAFAREQKIALTVVGPEGAARRRHRRRLPRRRALRSSADAGRGAARELEGLRQGVHGAPRHPDGAATRTFTDAAAAHAYVDRAGRADRRQGRRPRRRQGRRRRDDAWPRRTPRSTRCWSATRWATAGARVVIEEFLDGEEASFIVMADGTQRAAARVTARTTSACATATQGPNTGGMGAYSPAPVVTPALHARIMREIILPTVARHGGRRHPLHRLPLRRPDDRRARARRRRSSSTAAWATRRRSRS